jgi:oligopeptide/dipeptide ABC transporter ATP-binding protein
MNILNNIKINQGTSILLITHDLALVSEYTDDIAVMYAGRIVEQAPNKEFFSEPAHPYSQALLKSLPSNRGEKLATIQGQPPTLSQKIDGCKFNPRCKFCMDICTKEIPQLKNIRENHKTGCFLVK